MEKKQSSVDWFYQQIRYNDEGFTHEDLMEWHRQAKAMHKEEIEKAWAKGFTNTFVDENPEIYYNETFKTK